MTTNVCKCPQCGAIVKSKSNGKLFKHCGSLWDIKENLVSPSVAHESDSGTLEVSEVSESEIEYTLPAREHPRKIKDELVCIRCGGDVYGTERKGVYYCADCRLYMEEGD